MGRSHTQAVLWLDCFSSDVNSERALHFCGDVTFRVYLEIARPPPEDPHVYLFLPKSQCDNFSVTCSVIFLVVLTFLSAGPLAPVLRKVSPVKGRKRHWTQLYWEMLKPTMKLKQRK